MLTENITTEMVDTLYSAIETNSLAVLKNIIGKNIHCRLDIKPNILAIKIETLDFSTRAENCLRRAKADTIADIINMIENGSFVKMKCAGEKTRSEITGKIMAECYYTSSEKEKKEFCKALIELNFDDPEAA